VSASYDPPSAPSSGGGYYRSVKGRDQAGNWGSKVLSGVFGAYYYVQEANRSRGLRIDGSTSWVPGDVIHVAGRLATSGGERYLSSVRVIRARTTADVRIY
jgi:hypothetical protein